jgi:hypothetical protein
MIIQNTEAFLKRKKIRKEKYIFSFYLFEERMCRVDFPHDFQDSFLIEIPIPGERYLVP